MKVKLIEARLNIVRILVQYEMNDSSNVLTGDWNAGPVFFSHEDRCIARVSIRSAAESYSWVCAGIARDCMTVGALCIWPVVISVKSFTANCTKVAICDCTLLTRSMSLYSQAISCNLYCLAPFPVSHIPHVPQPTAAGGGGTDSGIFDAWPIGV